MADNTNTEELSRKQEILLTAKKLFSTITYEKTSIQKLLDELGIAKGTFYHYFKSKEDLLDQLVRWEAEQILTLISPIADRTDIDPLQKLFLLSDKAGEYKSASKEFYMHLLKVLNDDNNLLFRKRMMDSMTEMTLPVFSKIIKEGMDQNIFDVEDPDEAADLFMGLGMLAQKGMADEIIKYDGSLEAYPGLLKKMRSFESAYARILGIDPEKFRIFDPDVIYNFLKDDKGEDNDTN